jgi:hypothetical protein
MTHPDTGVYDPDYAAEAAGDAAGFLWFHV